MQMLRGVYYLYYKLYCGAASWGVRWDPTPQISAWLIMTAISWGHLLLVVSIVEWRLRHAVLPTLSKPQIVAIMVVLSVPLYFAFVYGGKYRRIVKTFDPESPRDRLRGRLAVAAYFVLFCIAFICAVRLRGKALGII